MLKVKIGENNVLPPIKKENLICLLLKSKPRHGGVKEKVYVVQTFEPMRNLPVVQFVRKRSPRLHLGERVERSAMSEPVRRCYMMNFCGHL